MNTRHLCLMIGLPAILAAGDPCGGARDLAKEGSYQSLVAEFKRPKAYWTADQVARVPELLRTRLRKVESSGQGCSVLGVLDVIDDLDRLTPGEKTLRAEILWAEGDFKAAEKAARDTELGPLFRTMLDEQKGKPVSPASQELVRANGFDLLRNQIRWQGLRKVLLGQEISRVLTSEAFLLRGETPNGFQSTWLAGSRAASTPWETAWAHAWSAMNLRGIKGLLDRSEYYLPDGLPPTVQKQVADETENRWDLPYAWAQQNLGKPSASNHVFPETFWDKVEAARLARTSSLDALAQAEATLARVASTPRDHYELAQIRLKDGSEEALKRLIADKEKLTVNPQLPGWTLESAQKNIRLAESKIEVLAAERVAEQKRREEALRLAEAKKKKAKEIRKNWEEFQEVHQNVRTYIARGSHLLQGIYRAAFAQEPTQPLVDNLHEVLASALRYPSTAKAVAEGIRQDWANGAGNNIASDKDIPLVAKQRVFSTVKQTLDSLRAPSGSMDPESPSDSEDD